MDQTVSIDTNIIVRFLTKDDLAQFEKAKRLIKDHQIFVPDTVILETEWVLRFAYGFTPDEVREAFRKFFGLENVWPQDAQRLSLALEWHESGVDFADALHLAVCQDTVVFMTFDKDLRKRISNISDCRVEEPE